MEGIEKVKVLSNFLDVNRFYECRSFSTEDRQVVEDYIRKNSLIRKTLIVSNHKEFWKTISKSIKVITKPANILDFYKSEFVILDNYNDSITNNFLKQHEKKCLYISEDKPMFRNLNKTWTKEEDELLLENLELPNIEIAEALNKSASSVASRRNNLGLSGKYKKGDWSKKEDTILETMYFDFESATNIAKKLPNKNAYQIKSRISNLNLPYRRKIHLLNENVSEEKREKVISIFDKIYEDRELTRTVVITDSPKEYDTVFRHCNINVSDQYCNIIFDKKDEVCTYGAPYNVYIVNSAEETNKVLSKNGDKTSFWSKVKSLFKR